MFGKSVELLLRALAQAEANLSDVGEESRAARLARLRESLTLPELRIVVFGNFAHGKSTLINAMVGRQVLPARLIPTTGQITRVVAGVGDEVRVRYYDGRQEACSLDDLDSLVSLNADSTARENIEFIEVAVDSPLLRSGVVLVDTPGLNDAEQQTARSREAISEADLVLLVLDARQLLSEAEQYLAVEWLAKELRKPVVPVVNFMNQVREEDDRVELRMRMDRWTQDWPKSKLGQKWFEINALGTLAHAIGKGPQPADDSLRLHEGLLKLKGTRRRGLQQASRCGQLAAEIGVATQSNHHILDRLRADAAGLKAQRHEDRERLTESRRQMREHTRVVQQGLPAMAKAKFDAGLRTIVHRLQGKADSTLKRRAHEWYDKEFRCAVREMEKEAGAALAQLAFAGLPRPTPFTVGEEMILGRLYVGVTRFALGDWLGEKIAGFCPSIIAGPVSAIGDWIGDMIGGVLAPYFGPQPDCAAHYAQEIRRRWTDLGVRQPSCSSISSTREYRRSNRILSIA